MEITVNDICLALEELAPLALQENYDNAGLQVGERQQPLSGVLLCVDVTEEIVQEAVEKNCNMIISHHPLIFNGIKSITGENYVERTLRMSILNDIAIYSSHTNLDISKRGVNQWIANKIGLKNIQPLTSVSNEQLKAVVFVPKSHEMLLRNAIFEVGAGQIGDYDCCSFSSTGIGTFRASDACKPYVGKPDVLHCEEEIRMEIILQPHLKNKVLKAIYAVHPYEEPAIDFYSMQTGMAQNGVGALGELETPEDETQFLNRMKTLFRIPVIRHTEFLNKPIQKVALCGGSGSSFIRTVIAQKADVFLSSDFKYHDFFSAEKKLIIADIGHFESEECTKEIFFEQLSKKFPTFAVHFSNISTNPINYL